MFTAGRVEDGVRECVCRCVMCTDDVDVVVVVFRPNLSLVHVFGRARADSADWFWAEALSVRGVTPSRVCFTQGCARSARAVSVSRDFAVKLVSVLRSRSSRQPREPPTRPKGGRSECTR